MALVTMSFQKRMKIFLEASRCPCSKLKKKK